MSLEKQAENLSKAITDLIISSVNAVIDNQKSTIFDVGQDNAAEPDKEKLTKKELTDLKKTAKAKAGKVLKELGKEKLGKLLKLLGAAKFSEIEDEAEIFNDFIEKADKILAGDMSDIAGEDDDLLGGSSAEKEYTIEDVKALLLKVNNAPTLGRDVTRQILAELGVARLPELKKDKFTKAVEKIEATLKDAGEE